METLRDIYAIVNNQFKMAQLNLWAILLVNLFCIVLFFNIDKWLLVFSCLSLVCVYKGLYPIAKNSERKLEFYYKSEINFFYYGFLAKIDSKKLLEKLVFYGALENDKGKLEQDLANQVCVLSSIADSKYKMFKYSLMLVMSGLFLSLLVAYLK